MSKPDDIPQDVWDDAEIALTFLPSPKFSVQIASVARAILAAKAEEREACAALAMAAIEAGDERHDVWLERYDVAISIALGIRKRGET